MSVEATTEKFSVVQGVLKEYMIKGFVMYDERLKQREAVFDRYYFRELLELDY